jgi:DNA-binding MarR family transcriptional regulator
VKSRLKILPWRWVCSCAAFAPTRRRNCRNSPGHKKAVLSRLEKHGPATAADLARAEGVKPQSMGTALGLLEKMGLVERKAHPTDGRQINIKLTARGITLRRNTKEAKFAWLSRAIAGLDRQEQTTLFKAGELIKRIAETS